MLDPLELCRFRVPSYDGATLGLVHSCARVISKQYKDEFVELETEAPESLRKRLKGYIDRAE